MAGLNLSAPRSDFKPARLIDLSPSTHRQHTLHASTRDWPQTNCYADLWIEMLNALGYAPEAMLGFTLTQDFEGDQFTFFKPPHADLEALYGLRVEELALYDRLETHIEIQVSRGRIVMVEVDGHYLPDTRGVTYRLGHSKTTIGITRFDAARSQLDYFHNDGFFTLENDDFDGALWRLPGQKRPETLFPYAEFVRLDDARRVDEDFRPRALELLRRHFSRRPTDNPLRAFAAEFPRLWTVMQNRPEDFFHAFAFNTVRQFGANFELLGAHLDWLDARFVAESAECRAISAGAKALQFNIARAMARKRTLDGAPALEELACAYDRLFLGLSHKIA